jgi:NitT/TauT family transport system substrate-binding protein
MGYARAVKLAYRLRQWGRTRLRSASTGARLAIAVLVIAAAPLLWTERLEQPDPTISVMRTADLGPLLLGLAKGYFRDAGFTFDLRDLKVAPSGRQSADRLKSGDAEIAYSTYVPFITDGNLDNEGVRFVSGASLAGPGSCLVVTMPGSGIKNVKDLVGVRIAVTEKGTISHSLVKATLLNSGIDPEKVTWVEMEFSKMSYKLANGEIDAAFLTEPYLSQVQEELDEVTVFDAAAGPLAGMPTAAYGTTAEFAHANPNTVAAFQKVMHRATREAIADWNSVVPLIQDFTKVPKDVAAKASLLTLQSGPEPDEVQRVADLMVNIGAMPSRFDVRKLFIRWPSPYRADSGIGDARPVLDNGMATGCRRCRRCNGCPRCRRVRQRLGRRRPAPGAG